MSLRTLIVDDEPLARAHLRAILERRDDVTVIGECGDGQSAIDRIQADAPDLVLLDVQMPELDGLSVVRCIGPERMPPVIFVTAYDQHALAAFEVHALDYILKPVNRARFQRAIDRVVAQSKRSSENVQREPLARLVEELAAGRPLVERLAVRAGDRVFYLRIADIDWIEAADDLMRIHVGKQIFEHRTTLSQLVRPRYFRVAFGSGVGSTTTMRSLSIPGVIRAGCSGLSLFFDLQHLAPAITARFEIDMVRPAKLARFLVLDIGRGFQRVVGTPVIALHARGFSFGNSHRGAFNFRGLAFEPAL